MPLPLLQIIQRVPLEREHEGWISWTIKEYFESLGLSVCLWALGHEEAQWHVDDLAEIDGKLFGLQFKMPVLDGANGRVGVQQLKWHLQKQDQFAAIKESHGGLFYCLPTFVNRDYRKASLHHSIIWRPTGYRHYRNDLWYDNPAANDWWAHIERDRDSYRWGNFIERLQQCEFGWRVHGRQLSDIGKKGLTSLIKRAYNRQERESSTDGFILVQAEVPLND